MSKMNRIRIINLSYNNNTMKIDDEMFELGGETTLLSLRNGGGKTVLVQMITSLFVNKKYRDTKDRPFSSYFTTNKPTIIMVEWKLDQGNAFFLTGMLVRKNQSMEDNIEPLEIINFTGSYQEACDYDIEHIPFIIEENGKKQLRGFGGCKRQFEVLHQKKENKFQSYDMSQAYQRKSYFKKLMEYQINYKEWETIIKQINLKESGLSELFADAKDERGLIEKWFLRAIQNKLNQENNRIKSFQDISYKFIKQYKENESKIQRKSIIEKYFEDVTRILEEIEAYKNAEVNLQRRKDEIAVFLWEINRIVNKLKEEMGGQEKEIKRLQREVFRLVYEKLSYSIYQLQDEKTEKVQERIESELQITRTSEKKKNANKEICKYQCARIYEEWLDYKNTKFKLQAQIDHKRQEQKENKQDIEKLGAKIYFLYEKQYQKKLHKLKEKEKEQFEKEEKKKACKYEKSQLEEKKNFYYSDYGKLETELHQFNLKEESFNKEYQDDLFRNLLGQYEDGLLEVKKKQYEQEINENNLFVTRLAEKNVGIESNLRKLQEERTNLSTEKNNIIREEQETTEKLFGFEQQKNRRNIILQYIELSQEYFEKKDSILEKIKYKIAELENYQDSYKQEQRAVEKELENLKEGIVMEIPERVLSFFEDAGIEYCIGMEWLKKNSYSYQDNSDLVKNNPLLPYSVMIPSAQIEKLKDLQEIYSDVPIPIIEREKLEQEIQKLTSNMISFDAVHFLCLFNEHLLHPEELEQLILLKQKNLNVLQDKIARKKKEIEEYREYYHEIEGQEYSKMQWEMLEKQLEIQKLRKEEIYERQAEIKKELENFEEQKKKNYTKIDEIKKKLYQFYEPRLKELCQIIDDYERYLENQGRYELRSKQIKDAEKQIKEYENLMEKIDDEIQELARVIIKIENQKDKLQQEVNRFESYKRNDVQETCVENEDLTKLCAEFEAMTGKVALELKELSKQLEREAIRMQKKEKELEEVNQYNLQPEDYTDLVFSVEVSRRLKEALEQAEIEENAAKEKNIELNVKIKEIEKDLEYQFAALQEEIQTKELIPRKEIVKLDFDKRIKLAKYEKKHMEQKLDKTKEKLNLFQGQQTAMAEYTEFTLPEAAKELLETFDDKLEDCSREKLNTLQGNLKRELNKHQNIRQKQKEKTGDVIRSIGNQVVYQEDFFKKGFENCLALCDQVEDLSHQVEVISASYKNILKQLQVDLENIDKERRNIEESFLEYVKEIHEHMDRIDKNSNINIRGKNVKMLKILVPDWEENKEVYKLRLKDYMEQLIHRGLSSIEEKENVEEVLGRLVTSKKMYDDIVGIQEIVIKLYKIEADREVQISWQQVASNSGGEGFLSAFVVLTSLLSYMRWDKADIFAPGNEGKVLIMDNPFAQTNAEHLLRPLIDIAKKTNTQLICLSGLGGDSIYNRFDNIYVLNVENSAIHHGLRYLKAEHKKGEEVQRLSLAQFKTEQLSFFDWEEV